MKDFTQYTNSLLLERYAIQNSLTVAEAEQRFEKVKLFLYQCSVSNLPLAPSREIDKLWHEFILFTRDYHYFCNYYLGKFIHHVPKVVEKNMNSNIQFYGVCDGGGDCDTGGNDGSE